MKSIVYGASVIGNLHKEKDIPNQDACIYKKIKSYTVMIVADGVSLTFDGEVSDSQIASQKACDEAMKYIQSALIHKKKPILEIIQSAFVYTEKKLIQMIDSQDPSRYLTTLTIGIIDAKQNLIFGNAGDSGILYINEENKIHLVTKRKQSNMVHSLFENEYWEFGVVRNVKAACVATDGILDEFTKELRCDRYYPFNLNFINYLFVHKRMVHSANLRFAQLLKQLSSSVTVDDKTAILYFKDIRKIPLYKTTPLTQKQINDIYNKINQKVFHN